MKKVVTLKAAQYHKQYREFYCNPKYRTLSLSLGFFNKKDVVKKSKIS